MNDSVTTLFHGLRCDYHRLPAPKLVVVFGHTVKTFGKDVAPTTLLPMLSNNV